VKNLNRKGMMNTEIDNDGNKGVGNISLEFESINSNSTFSVEKEILPTTTCLVWKTIISAKGTLVINILNNVFRYIFV
jgi:hypothetical protein